MDRYFEVLRNSSPPETIHKKYECIFSELREIPSELEPLWLTQKWINSAPKEKSAALIWRDKKNIKVLGVMEDSDVFTSAKGKNDRTWEKGDVFEFFIQPSGGQKYFEIHTAPNLATLELEIPGIDIFRTKTLSFEEMISDIGFSARAGIIEKNNLKGWWALMSIPMTRLGIHNIAGSIAGKFSICRYNYNKKWGKKPECSSVSPLPELSFHCPEHWHELILV